MALVSLGVPVLFLEWTYRGQLVDLYRPELRAFNPARVLEPGGRAVVKQRAGHLHGTLGAGEAAVGCLPSPSQSLTR